MNTGDKRDESLIAPERGEGMGKASEEYLSEQKAVQPVLAYEYNMLMRLLGVSVSKHLLDDHYTVIWANDFYYQMIGWSRSEYEETYHNQCDLYYKTDREEWERLVSAVNEAFRTHQNGYNLVSQIRRKNGELIWVQFSTAFAEEYVDGYQVAYTTITNIDSLVRMQKEQSVTYENLPGFVAKYRVEADGFYFLDANDRFREFFACHGRTWPDRGLSNLDSERNRTALQKNFVLMRKGKPVHFTLQAKDHSGNNVWLQVNADCIDWVNEAPVYLVIYIDITDITEQRELQRQLEDRTKMLNEALEEAEKANRSKSEFLSRMSHDIRTPMNAIVGMTEIASAHLENSQKVQNCLKKISLSSQHLLGLINDVLDMSKIESGKMALRYDFMDLPEVLENVIAIVQPMIKNQNQQFSVRLCHVIHEQFSCDALRLRQVFINILSNASKFTPEGGSITMTVEETDCNCPGAAQFCFSFSDTGIGIKPEFLDQVFDTFSRDQGGQVEKIEGSGLGMAITKRIVELMGGSITVQSEWGKGTIFLVRLPLQIEEHTQMIQRLPGLKVLVADDDIVMCEYTAQMLKENGIEVKWATGGAEAVEQAVSAYRQGADFDAVIVDWKMPGQDGLETVKRIRDEVGQEVPILIVSAYDWTEIEEDALQAGANGFLQKPLFRSTLLRGLNQYVLNGADRSLERKREYPNALNGKTILVVEDNDLNREIAVELLSAMGAQVDTACNGEEGVRAFDDSPEHTYNLILMDVQMPVMDGYTATRKIRSLQRADASSIPILAMTADAFAEDIEASKEAGMNEHIAKPLDLMDLKKKIQDWI